MLRKLKHLWHTSDRFRTAMSAAVGVFIVLMQYSFLFIPEVLVLPAIPLIYFGIPFLITKGRKVTFRGKRILNADGKSILRILPKNLFIPALIIFASSALTPSMLRSFWNEFLPKNTDFMMILRDSTVFAMPYIIFHLYFFIKNIPIPIVFEIIKHLEPRSYSSDSSINFGQSSYRSQSPYGSSSSSDYYTYYM